VQSTELFVEIAAMMIKGAEHRNIYRKINDDD